MLAEFAQGVEAGEHFCVVSALFFFVVECELFCPCVDGRLDGRLEVVGAVSQRGLVGVLEYGERVEVLGHGEGLGVAGAGDGLEVVAGC